MALCLSGVWVTAGAWRAIEVVWVLRGIDISTTRLEGPEREVNRIIMPERTTEQRLLYIGEKDCQKASCNRKQEFPDSDDPYCLLHSLEDFFGGNDEPI